ncbi:hypothetical protein [Mesorhizobium sp.]|uniref:hypothetical protein n=1 Tax=Mesorhizobium sp. TaxID=1871066 RepID=UPI0011FBB484|nr:hypothetical protein [Mesorhizobium sp.]TIX20711.1 MAG: hypothetical protein E5V35_31880 [Mesorhizobium sp.]
MFEVHPADGAELFDAPPAVDDWSHEVKFDDCRTKAIKDEDCIRFYTKNGFDWATRYWPKRQRRSMLEPLSKAELSWPVRQVRNS